MVGALALVTLIFNNRTPYPRERFVCVEPGYVRGFKKLGPGETWIGQQVLVVA